MNSFNKKRYVLIKNFFSPKDLLLETNKIILQAKRNKWKFIKVYFNAYVKDFVNIFAVCYPLNKIFKSNLASELYKLNYKPKIKEITGWNEIKTTALEIQHNQKYNYQSNWHRDWHCFPSPCLNIIIYLEDEVGLRIIPSNKDKLVKKLTKTSKINYLKISKKYYDVINANAGDILVMDSGLIHQGFARGKRTHIFIRCEEKKNKTRKLKTFVNDYSISKQLDPQIKFNRLNILSKRDTYDFDEDYYSLKNKIKSCIFTLLYYFPFHKIFKYFLDLKRKKIHFHYTFYQ